MTTAISDSEWKRRFGEFNLARETIVRLRRKGYKFRRICTICGFDKVFMCAVYFSMRLDGEDVIIGIRSNFDKADQHRYAQYLEVFKMLKDRGDELELQELQGKTPQTPQTQQLKLKLENGEEKEKEKVQVQVQEKKEIEEAEAEVEVEEEAESEVEEVDTKMDIDESETQTQTQTKTEPLVSPPRITARALEGSAMDTDQSPPPPELSSPAPAQALQSPAPSHQQQQRQRLLELMKALDDSASTRDDPLSLLARCVVSVVDGAEAEADALLLACEKAFPMLAEEDSDSDSDSDGAGASASAEECEAAVGRWLHVAEAATARLRRVEQLGERAWERELAALQNQNQNQNENIKD